MVIEMLARKRMSKVKLMMAMFLHIMSRVRLLLSLLPLQNNGLRGYRGNSRD